jgi:phosphoglycerate dehydrogenase-like enzyme
VALAVHFCHPPEPEHLTLLRRLLDPGIIITSGAELPAQPSVEILVCARPQHRQLAACPSLRALIIPFAGPPPETLALMAAFPAISVHNLHHNAAATAETALGLLLAAAKFLVPVDRSLRLHNWTPRYEPPPIAILAGRAALILGYGAIGRRLARALQALDVRVLATRRRAETVTDDGIAEIHPPGHLHTLLPQANILAITLPHTPETTGLIGAAELALLPPGALFVNVGRGPIVAEAPLYEALHSGRLLAAGIDVWWRYPDDRPSRSHTPPSAFPFHELENVVLSPHRGGMGGAEEIETLRYTALAQLLNAAANGEAIPNRIDLSRGY